MRNHGFVRESGRWRLSPAFDVNPNTDLAKTHTTALDGRYDSGGILATLPAAAQALAVERDAARDFVDHVHDAVQTSPGLSDEVKVMETDLHAEAVSALRAAR